MIFYLHWLQYFYLLHYSYLFNGIWFIRILGPLFRPIMRPLFTLPGRSTVDNLASFIGDGTVGVLITSRQYERGIYSRRESIVISTTFSVVSITFAIVIAETVGLQHKFFCILFNCNYFMFCCCNDHATYLAIKQNI